LRGGIEKEETKFLVIVGAPKVHELNIIYGGKRKRKLPAEGGRGRGVWYSVRGVAPQLHKEFRHERKEKKKESNHCSRVSKESH